MNRDQKIMVVNILRDLLGHIEYHTYPSYSAIDCKNDCTKCKIVNTFIDTCIWDMNHYICGRTNGNWENLRVWFWAISAEVRAEQQKQIRRLSDEA